MLTIYCRDEHKLIAATDINGQTGRVIDQLPANVLWLDLLNPTPEEAKQAEVWSGLDIPTHADMVEIEESSRFYHENGAQYLTAPFLHTLDDKHRMITPVSFILTENILITVRYAEPKSIKIYADNASKSNSGLIDNKTTSLCIMLDIIEATTSRLADIVESLSDKIDNASMSMYQRAPNDRPMSTEEFRKILTDIGSHGSFLSRLRESLAGIRRLLVYVAAPPYNNNREKQHQMRSKSHDFIKSLERDAQSLENYIDYLSNKINFMLDTIVGLISIEQNSIIKIFSVAAVGFMPPTLIASIYGMNFATMPELSTSWGYPAALSLMIVSALLPLAYFRKKGWL